MSATKANSKEIKSYVFPLTKRCFGVLLFWLFSLCSESCDLANFPVRDESKIDENNTKGAFSLEMSKSVVFATSVSTSVT